MIHEAKQQLVEMGFSEIQQFEDGYGTIGYGVKYADQIYILVAKEYAYNDLASFIAQLVVKATDEVDFIFYNGDNDSFTVFDGKYLKKNAEESSGESKKRDCAWREIPMEHGADLPGVISGKESPDTLSGRNKELEAFI